MKEEMEEIYAMVCRLNNAKPKLVTNPSHEIKKGLALLEKKIERLDKAAENNIGRVNNILDVVMSLANLNYSSKAYVSGKGDHFDALATGINMLGEELQSSTISLQEKEVLLKEIHHRVKNNLQVISSLLNLQTEYFTDQHSLEKFNESRNRVRSMSLVHEKLYKSKDLSKIDFKEYVEELVLSINSSYNLNNEKIKTQIRINLSNALFNIDIAIPCGLIINELLSNCYKYAFPNNKAGTIKITFNLQKEKTGNFYHLSVADNGVGMKEPVDIHNASTLGLQLVHLLTEQLGGEVNVKLEKGLAYTIVFPEA
jgi:two-component sensor histidine kinase